MIFLPDSIVVVYSVSLAAIIGSEWLICHKFQQPLLSDGVVCAHLNQGVKLLNISKRLVDLTALLAFWVNMVLKF